MLSNQPKTFKEIELAPAKPAQAKRYETYDTNLAAFQISRGQVMIDSRLAPDHTVFYIFPDAEACESLEHEFRFGDPQAPIQRFIQALNTCRNIRRALEEKRKKETSAA